MMHTPDRENDPWDTAMPAEIRQDLVDYAQPPAATRPTPDAGLLQQLPSTFGEIFDHLYDTAYNPREWQMPPILAEIERSMREARNGEVISQGESHTRERDALRAACRANPDIDREDIVIDWTTARDDVEDTEGEVDQP